ncbi:MAG TPA: hypothetical protein VM077_01955 [Candidatus Limnocylindrales bacterium]|nr:hypothetical protein [Candidatus Limnocylindrales bacterium]
MESQKTKLLKKTTKTFRKAFWHVKTSVQMKPVLIALIVIPTLLLLFGKREVVKAPVITITTPIEKNLITDQQVYVRGKVWPSDAKLRVSNKAEIAQNGNGEFTAMVNVPVGKSVLKFFSSYRGKESSMIFPIERRRSPVEELAYQQQLERDKVLGDQKVAGLKNEVMNRVNKLQDVQSMIKVTEQKVATIGAQRKVTGTLTNSGPSNAYGVTALVTFFDSTRSVVDVQEAKVVEGATPMQPGQSLPFSTLPSAKVFASFDVAVRASAQPTASSDEDGNTITPTPTTPFYVFPN